MSEAKLQVKIGGVEFSGEGSEKWLSEQLKEILGAAPKVAAAVPPAPINPPAGGTKPPPASGTFTQTLASYLTAKKASGNQVHRFLATADWLRQKGEALSTAAVAKALIDHHQARLSNASECLNQNVSKGFAEKVPGGKGFFITPDGLKSLGHAVE